MLDAMPEEEFQERYCEWILSGEGEGRTIAAAVMSAIHNATSRDIASRAAECDVARMMTDVNDFLPKWFRVTRKKSTTTVSSTDGKAVTTLAKTLGILNG